MLTMVLVLLSPQKRTMGFKKPRNLRLEKQPVIGSLSQPKELSVCLGPIKHKLDQVQSKLNKCGLTQLIIKLITNRSHPEVCVICGNISIEEKLFKQL